MGKITRVNVAKEIIDIRRDLSVSTRLRKPGPPERIDGMTIGIVVIDPKQASPHAGEVHPDGDEILLVISGRIRVIGESDPENGLELGAGEMCIVEKGEWHLLQTLEAGQLIHITPGPRGDYRRIH